MLNFQEQGFNLITPKTSHGRLLRCDSDKPGIANEVLCLHVDDVEEVISHHFQPGFRTA